MKTSLENSLVTNERGFSDISSYEDMETIRDTYVQNARQTFYRHCFKDLVSEWKHMYRRLQPSKPISAFVRFGLAGVKYTLKKSLERAKLKKILKNTPTE